MAFHRASESANLSIDLLGETAARELIQIEVQSKNDPSVPFRILEYLVSENKVLGPAYKRGLLQGREEGLHEGRHDGQISLLRQLIERNIGPFPSWAEAGLTERSDQGFEQIAIRVFDAATLEKLLLP